MKIKPWREWSDDTMWIVAALAITAFAVVMALWVMPP